MEAITVIGLISGSSLDGLDLAICRFSGVANDQLKWELLAAKTVGFSESLSERLAKATSLSALELMALEVTFSEFCATVVNELKDTYHVDYIASHGHTVFHFPEKGFTHQIGKGSILAELTGIDTICDFRSNDIALGGQGAPVAPIVEQVLFGGYQYYLNLGGIANVSVHTDQGVYSLDVCPCNQVLNAMVQEIGLPYDDKGQLAERGQVHEALITKWSSLPYFALPFPKSMDNSWVRDTFMPIIQEFDLEREDVLATMVEFVGRQLARDISDLPQIDAKSAQLMVTGGGGHNDHLIQVIERHLLMQNIQVHLPDTQIVDSKEAILMALMGYLRVSDQPNVIATVTGATTNSYGGGIYRASTPIAT